MHLFSNAWTSICVLGFVRWWTCHFDFQWEWSLWDPLHLKKATYGKYKSQIESFCRELECQDLKKANIHKALQKEWLHSSKCPLLSLHTFTLWSSLGLHSKETHKEFLAVLLFCKCWTVQSPQFWLLFYSQAEYSQVWGLDVPPLSCEYTRLQKWAGETFWRPTTKVCAYFRQCSQKVLLFTCTTWPEIAVWEFR